MVLVREVLLAGYRTRGQYGGCTSSRDGQSRVGSLRTQCREQNDKPSGRSVLFRAPCLFPCPGITHKLNAHFPPLPLFFSCSDFSHVYLLASGRTQLVFLSLKETGRHTRGCGGAGETPTELGSWNQTVASLNWSISDTEKALHVTRDCPPPAPPGPAIAV